MQVSWKWNYIKGIKGSYLQVYLQLQFPLLISQMQWRNLKFKKWKNEKNYHISNVAKQKEWKKMKIQK
jgi:hypothetical protein